MAGIKKSYLIHQNLPTEPSVKYVKKAKMFCKTVFDDKSKQIQTWTVEKPQLYKKVNIVDK